MTPEIGENEPGGTFAFPDHAEPLTPLDEMLLRAPFVLAAHDGGDDPILRYGNLAAQELFEYPWDEFVGTPSRFTAEPPERSEREGLLEQVRTAGFIDDYSGIRVTASGRRFRIHRATVWNLEFPAGQRVGQAAMFSEWTFL